MLIVLAIVLGLVSGLGLTVIELGASPTGTVQADFLVNSGQGPAGRRPHIVVDKEEFDFGTMEHDTTQSHKFTVRNDGEAPLKLTDGGVSCGRCTSFSIAKAELQPGEESTVEVQWKGINGGPFRQSANLNTNDPLRSNVSFTITGKVLSSYRFSPDDLDFSNLSAAASPTVDLHLFSYQGSGLAVLSHELVEAGTADNFDVQIKPMPADVLATDPDAKSGIVVQVKVKPGLPLGLIRQKIRLRLNLPDNPVVEVPVEANVVSDMQVIGRDDWDAMRGALNLGTFPSREGAKTELFLLARGPHRHELKPKVHEVTPDYLKVTIGKVTDMAGGESVRIPLTVAIPPGAPAGVHLGNQQGELGDILIDTGDPDAKMVHLRVRFAVGE
jgi:hypothetical protein